MTAVVELGGVAAIVSAASTLGASGHSHCFNFKPRARHHHRKVHHLDPPHRKQLLEGALRKDGVQVRIDQASIGRRSIEFNGEVLFIAGAGDKTSLAPALALGGCDVKIIESRIVAIPPAIAPIEIIFDSPDDAGEWATDFKEACLVGPPHERIQELIVHGVTVDKDVEDLRNRALKVREMEELNKKLKHDLHMKKAGFLDDDVKKQKSMFGVFGKVQSFTDVTAMDDDGDGGPVRAAKSSWFLPTSAAASQPEIDELNNQLQQQKDESEKAQSLAEDLKRQMVGHVPPEVHAAVHEQMRQHKVEFEKAQEEASELRRRMDELLPKASQGRASSSTSSSAQAMYLQHAAGQERLAVEFDEKLQEVRQQLALSQQSFQEERRRADTASARVQVLMKENEAMRTQIGELDSAGRSMVEAFAMEKRAHTASVSRPDEMEEKMQQRPEPLQLQRAVEEMQLSFHDQLEAHRVEFINQLEDQKNRHDRELRQLKGFTREPTANGSVFRSQSTLSVESEGPSSWRRTDLDSRADELAEENLSLKRQLAEKARRIEAEHLRFEAELHSFISPRVEIVTMANAPSSRASYLGSPIQGMRGSSPMQGMRTASPMRLMSTPQLSASASAAVSLSASASPLPYPMPSHVTVPVAVPVATSLQDGKTKTAEPSSQRPVAQATTPVRLSTEPKFSGSPAMLTRSPNMSTPRSMLGDSRSLTPVTSSVASAAPSAAPSFTVPPSLRRSMPASNPMTPAQRQFQSLQDQLRYRQLIERPIQSLLPIDAEDQIFKL